MKTLEELYGEMLVNEELKAELAQVNSAEAMADFLHKHGCDATWDEFKAFMLEKQASHEMSNEELDQVAGGSVGTIIASLAIWWGCTAASIAIAVDTDDSCLDALFG